MTKRMPTVVEVNGDGIKVLKGTVSEDMMQVVPSEKGVYQWRPVAKVWEGDNEHGNHYPIYGWAKGELSIEEWPDLRTLPTKLY